MPLGQHGLGGFGIAALDVADDAIAVDGVRDRLPHRQLGHDRIAQVHADVLVDRAGRLDHLEVGALVELADVLEWDDVHFHVDRSAPQLEHHGGGVGDDADGDVLDLRRAAVPLIERFELEALVRTVVDDLVRPAADRSVLVDGRVRAGGKDAEGQVVEDAGIRLLQLEDDGVIVRRLDVIERRVA